MSARLPFAAVLATAVMTATGAVAAERAWLKEVEAGPDGVRSVEIDLSDLDLAAADGPEILRDRVRYAAFIVCDGPLPDHVFYGGQSRARAACRKDAVRSVEYQLSGPDSRVGSEGRAVAVVLRGAPAASVN